MRPWFRIEPEPFTVPLFCLLFAYAGERAVISFLLSCLAHEAGHLFFFVLFRVPVKKVTVGVGGVSFVGDFSACGYGREAILCAGGALVNALLAVWFTVCSMPFPAALNLLLLGYNLLPYEGRDGARILESLSCLAPLAMQAVLFRILSVLSTLTEAATCVFGAWLCWFLALQTDIGEMLPLLCFSWILSVLLKTVLRPRSKIGQRGIRI